MSTSRPKCATVRPAARSFRECPARRRSSGLHFGSERRTKRAESQSGTGIPACAFCSLLQAHRQECRRHSSGTLPAGAYPAIPAIPHSLSPTTAAMRASVSSSFSGSGASGMNNPFCVHARLGRLGGDRDLDDRRRGRMLVPDPARAASKTRASCAWAPAGACARSCSPAFSSCNQSRSSMAASARSSSRAHTSPSNRASTNSSGSSRSTGYSSSISSSKRGGASTGSERPVAFSARQFLQPHAFLAQPRGDSEIRQRGQIAKRANAPARQRLRHFFRGCEQSRPAGWPEIWLHRHAGRMLMPAKIRAPRETPHRDWKRSRHSPGTPARRAMACAISWTVPNRWPRPSISRITVSAPVCSTCGEKSCAQASKPRARAGSMHAREHGRSPQGVRFKYRACRTPRLAPLDRERRAAQKLRAAGRARPVHPAARAFERQRWRKRVHAAHARLTTSAVGVFSTARRSRYHDASEMRRAVSGAMSPRSITTRPNPPACSNRSVGFERMLGIAAAANPQQPLERHARCRGRRGIESVARIHQRAEFFARRRLSHQRQQPGWYGPKKPARKYRSPIRAESPPSAASNRGFRTAGVPVQAAHVA